MSRRVMYHLDVPERLWYIELFHIPEVDALANMREKALNRGKNNM